MTRTVLGWVVSDQDSVGVGVTAVAYTPAPVTDRSPGQGKEGQATQCVKCGSAAPGAGARRVKDNASRGLPSSAPPPFRGISGPSPSDVSAVATATARLSQIKLLRASKVSWSRRRSKQWRGRGSARGSRGRSGGSLSRGSGRRVRTRGPSADAPAAPTRVHFLSPAAGGGKTSRQAATGAGTGGTRPPRTRQTHQPGT